MTAAMHAERAVRAPEVRTTIRDLFHSRHLIAAPTPRLLALGALLAAARRWSMPQAPLKQAMREALAQLSGGQPRLRDAAAALEPLMASADASLPARLRQLIAPGSGGQVGTVSALLGLGLVSAARDSARRLPRTTPRQAAYSTRMIRLAQTGIDGTGDHRRFVASPTRAARFPPSLPVVVRCIEALILQPDPVLEATARAITAQLSIPDQQAARVHWALHAWRQGGLTEAAAVLRSIRYKSRRAEAGLALITAALHDEVPEQAERLIALLPESGRSRATAAALLADGPQQHPPAEADCALSVARTLRCLRDGTMSAPALKWTARDLREPAVSAQVLEAMAAQGRSLVGELSSLRARLGASATDHLWAAHITRQCAQLPAPPEGPLPSPVDDEQRMLTEAGWARRRGAVRVSRSVLMRAAFAPTAPGWEARLRSLRSIGGDLAVNVLIEILERTPSSGAVLGPQLREAAAAMLVEIAPRRAVRWLSGGAETLPASLLCALFSGLALRHQLHPDLPRQWQALFEQAGADFCARLLRVWRQQSGGLPAPAVLDGARRELLASPGTEPSTLLDAAVADISEMMLMPPLELAAVVAADPVRLARLRWIAPARLPAGAMPWSDTRLRSVLATLCESPEQVTLRPLERLLAHLSPERQEPLRTDLLQGRPLSAQGAVQPLSARLRLRQLDKRRDLLTFMRLADAVSCCWDTRSSYSPQTHSRLRSLWRDPLSLAFHVEARSEGGWLPVGFVFGSLGLVEDGDGQTEAALLLNGVYLRRQKAKRRDQVLAALEARAAGLGIAHIGVASVYNGRGPMPERYRLMERRVRRLRALSVRGALVQFAIDDISMGVNSVQRLRHLYWLGLRV